MQPCRPRKPTRRPAATTARKRSVDIGVIEKLFTAAGWPGAGVSASPCVLDTAWQAARHPLCSLAWAGAPAWQRKHGGSGGCGCGCRCRCRANAGVWVQGVWCYPLAFLLLTTPLPPARMQKTDTCKVLSAALARAQAHADAQESSAAAVASTAVAVAAALAVALM